MRSMRFPKRGAISVVATMILAGVLWKSIAPLVAEESQAFPEIGPLPAVQHPADNPATPAKVELGRRLFFDPRLSGNGWMSCASCHNPGLGFSDALPRSLGKQMKELNRHTPALYNVAYQSAFFWDGRAKSLEEQALMPIQSSDEMHMDMEILLTRIKSLPEYGERFKEVFGEGSVSAQNVARAIAAFERTILSKDSPFDRYLKGDADAMPIEAKRGLILFKGKAQCIQCHNGPNFTDDGFHNIGVRQAGPLKHDEGRFKVSNIKINKGAFKTPTLRHTARTAPYMHNGALSTLEEVVELYDRGGDDKGNLDPLIKPLALTTEEKTDLVAFLKALTGGEVEASVPVLPR